MIVDRKFLFPILLAFHLSVYMDVCAGTGWVEGERIFPSLNKQRASNAFYNSIHFQKLSATRFLPLFTTTGTGNWASPRTIITLDGLPYAGYPFGMQSIDLVPVDLVTVDTLVVITGIGMTQGRVSAGGSIDIVRSPIPDTLHIDARLFTGSETGDPLIHIFTQPKHRLINKNKVGPSFALAISNTDNNWSYRISGGGFFYFSTGSVNDFTISRYNPELINRQNRQVKVIGEAVYTIDEYRQIDFYTAGINLFGWEMSPFTSLFNHYTNISSTGRVRYRDSASGVSLALVRDESFVWTKQMKGALPGSIRVNEWTFYPSYEFSLPGNISFSLFGNVGLLRVKDIDGHKPDKQMLLLQDINFVAWGSGIEFSFLSGKLFSRGGVRIDQRPEQNPALSAEFLSQYTFSSYGSLHASIGSAAYQPEYLEQFGIFRVRRGENEFTMSGNPDLLVERVNEIKLGYSRSGAKVSLFTEAFARKTNDQINRDVIRSYRSADTRDILRTLTYVNDGSKFVPGITLQINLRPFHFLRILSDHQYIDNSESRSLPRYKNINSVELLLPLYVVFELSVLHIGETIWNEFMLAAGDDEYLGEGFDGRIGKSTVFDISVSRAFDEFYFSKGLEISLQAKNLFNTPTRRIPVGNYLDRAVFVYVSFRL